MVHLANLLPPAASLAAASLAAASLAAAMALLALPARAQPLPQQPPTPTATNCTTPLPNGVPVLLRELDACFARGDIAAYMAHFTPDHPGALAVLQQRLERWCEAVPQRQRRSTLVGDARTIGPRVVVRVRSEVELGRAGDGPHAVFADEWLLALDVAAGDGGTGSARPTFAVEIPAEANWRGQALLRCPACNYEIGGVAGWLMVPVRGDRAHALEAASFYLLGTDIACDVSVECAAEPVPAATLAAELGGTLQALAGPRTPAGIPTAANKTVRHPAEPWLPPSLRPTPPRGLDGARIAVDLPDEGGGGARSLLHVAVFGGLQHLLMVRGSKQALARHAADVDALLASYHLLQVDGAMVRAGSEALAHHCGGQVDGSTYTNVLHDVALFGPDGWRLQQRTGGAAFRAVWTSPGGSTLWLSGHQVPPGMQHWSRETADAWLRHLCTQQRLTVVAGSEVAWTDDTETGVAWRTFDAETNAGASGPRHRVRVLLRKDLLVVATGIGRTSADDEAIRAALPTLRRR
jgi:hypothetical protein